MESNAELDPALPIESSMLGMLDILYIVGAYVGALKEDL